MVMKLTPNLEETTVQGIDMKCFLIGSSVMCFSINQIIVLLLQDCFLQIEIKNKNIRIGLNWALPSVCLTIRTPHTIYTLGISAQSFPHLFCCQGASDRVPSVEQTYVRKTENSNLNNL